MKRSIIAVVPIALFTACTTPDQPTSDRMTYPETRKDSLVGDTLHGTFVADPYRWLENDTSAETADWVKRQNALTNSVLEKIPFRSGLAKRYEKLIDHPTVSAPIKVGEHYFQYRNTGLQNQSVIYVRTGLDGKESVFIDPNAVDPNGTTSLHLMGASTDRRYICVSVQKAGSDWQDITVYDLSTMKQMSDVLKWAKFSGVAWYKDGFFYSRYPEPKKGTELSAASQWQKVYYHKLGDAQEKDVLVYENTTNPNLYIGMDVTEGEEFAGLTISTGTDGYEQYFLDLRKSGMPNPSTKWTALQTGFDHKTSLLDMDPKTGQLLVMTDVDAPNYRLVSVDPNSPSQADWKDIIPHRDNLLEHVSIGGGSLFAHYLKDVTTRIYRYNMDGSGELEIALPGLGSASGFGARRGEPQSFYSFSSFADPNSIYSFDYATGKSELFFRPELSFDPGQFVTEQVFFPSKDGTKIPMFITHKKGIERNGKNPTLLYAYGGFNISLTPYFSTEAILMMEQGGVYCVANLRGGGEYGEEWHKAGMKEKKQNVFDDFIGAAEYLMAMKWTDRDHLAIEGGSNGGLLIGAVMTQRPELFKVCFPEVGVLDMLRFQKFTAGFGWTPEYGDADSSRTDFEYLM
ncbi:MAG: S9 family peptidase, partial [Flavobacteriales bacterium]|nr:S9 family peptidase [Flavobacteriales bacterium]